MIGRVVAEDIDREAAVWAVKLDAGELGASERVRLEEWLSGDRRRRGALLRAQAGLSLLVVAEPQTAGLRPQRRPDRRALFGGLGAAAAAMGLLAVLPALSGKRYRTGVGEIRRVPLEDGSLAAINTDTKIDIAFQAGRRDVRLEQGEAWFQVAKDISRPFIVAAGDVRVRAVGTAFSVRRRPMGVEVLVTEGVVEVSSAGGGRPTRVAAGDQIFVGDAGPPAKPLHRPLEMERALAWRDGQIALDGDTVAAAAAEFNRYNARKIVVTDPRLEGRRVVGWFHTNEPESFARAVALSEKSEIDETGSLILLGG